MTHNLVNLLGDTFKLEDVLKIVYDDLLNANLIDNYTFQNWQQFLMDNNAINEWRHEIPDNVNNKSYLSILSFGINLFESPKWKDIKELKKYKSECSYEHEMTCFLTEKGILGYKYSSYYLPFNSQNKFYVRTKDDLKNIPDCFDCSDNSTIYSDYRPWVIKKRLYGSPDSINTKWEGMGHQIFFDIEDVKQLYDFETSELIRCFKIAKKLKKEYCDSIKESRKVLAEANKIRKQANKKSAEAKQRIIDIKNKINKTLLRKMEIEGDF